MIPEKHGKLPKRMKIKGKTITAGKLSVFGVFLVRIFPHSDWMLRHTPHFPVFSPNTGKHGPETLRIRTLFTQCITDKNSITRSYNKLLINVGPSLAKKIPETKICFREFLTTFDKEMEFKELYFQEFKTTFKSIKQKKALGIDDLHASIMLVMND